MANIGLEIKKLRKIKNLNQEDVAKHIDLTLSAISAYEVGRVKPSYENLQKLEVLFGAKSGHLTDMLIESNLTDHEAVAKVNEINTPLTAEAFALLKAELEYLRSQLEEKNKESAWFQKQLSEMTELLGKQ